MKCAQLRLQERARPKPDFQPKTGKEMKPRRYCQKRMVDPAHEEDPRWMNIFQRYHCKKSFEQGDITEAGLTPIENQDDICLTVQNLKFQGEVQDNKRPRTSFKYRLPSDNKRHRMFVKQVVEDIEVEDDLSSQLTSYYFDDYVKYILSNDRSRPSSSKSSVFLDHVVHNGKESKAVQVENKLGETKNNTKHAKKYIAKTNEEVIDKRNADSKEDNIDDAKVSFHKSGKRKSLTISRVPSPETVQVIRVDVVCNYSTSSALSDYEDKKINTSTNIDKIEDTKLKGPHFSNKYLLTNTVKTLDENVSGGAKVTLLCKTFKLSDRLKLLTDSKKSKMAKDVTKLRK